MIIHVKYNSNHPLAVDVSPMQDVAALKQEIAAKYGLELSQIRIIFQGKELTDDVHLQDCDFGMHTVIHAVKGQRQQASRRMPEAPQAAEENLVSLNPLPEEYRDQYFVYCKECHGMRNGRIRVRCKTCKEGAFTINRDPGCWDDVLIADRISGSCLSQGCSGTVAEFFFKCKGHTNDTGSSCVPLHHIRPNRRAVPCLACTDVLSPILVFPCENQHVMCVDCFQSYCVSKLNDRAFISTDQHGYTLPCPGCDNGVIEEPHHFRLMGDEQYERYQRFGAEECLLEAGGVLCPTPGCGAGLLPDTNDRRVECVVQAGTGCGLVFCRQCLEMYHDGSCDQQPQNPAATSARSQIDAAQLERAQWDREAKELIKKTTKPCPQCKSPIEKDGGCMHMTCTRCRFNWCWLCETEWNRTCQARHWFG